MKVLGGRIGGGGLGSGKPQIRFGTVRGELCEGGRGLKDH